LRDAKLRPNQIITIITVAALLSASHHVPASIRVLPTGHGLWQRVAETWGAARAPRHEPRPELHRRIGQTNRARLRRRLKNGGGEDLSEPARCLHHASGVGRRRRPFDLQQYFAAPADDAAPFYLDALFEFDPESMASCLSPTQFASHGSIPKGRAAGVNQLAAALEQDPRRSIPPDRQASCRHSTGLSDAGRRAAA